MENQNKPQNPSAYPSFIIDYRESAMQCKTVYQGQESGMTLRDYFAAKAMQSIVNNFYSSVESRDYILKAWKDREGTPKESISIDAYKLADAMLKEREKE